MEKISISKTDTSTSDVTSYTWSPFGKLETVTLPNTDVVTYKYDGYGRKAQLLLNGTVQYALLYQGQLRPVAQMDSSGNLIARFIWGQKLNTPEYIVKSGVSYRLVTDPRGSVRLVLKADDGTVAQRLDYNEWGEVTNDTSPGFQPFGYAGGLYDHQTKLTEFGARHYDAEVGRFTAKDPIGFAGGDTNLYAYVRNNPVNFIDPTGLRPGDIFPTLNEAGRDAINYTNPTSISQNREYGGYIYGNDRTGFTYTDPVRGTTDSLTLPGAPTNTVADFHTHGAYDPNYLNEQFSDADLRSNQLSNTTGFLGTPGGNFLRNDPFGGISQPRTCGGN